MSPESPQFRRARQDVEDRDLCHAAATELRRRVGQGRYTGLGATAADDLDYLATVLDSAGRDMRELPAQTRRDVLHAARRLVPDGRRKPGPVAPITDPRGGGV